MDVRSLYSPAPADGWLPWGLFAPVVCLMLAVVTQLPADLWMEQQGFIDTNGDTAGTRGLIVMLLVPFLAWALAVYAWVRLVERRPLATIGLAAGGARTFLVGHLVGVATISGVVALIWLAGAYQARRVAPAWVDPGAMLSIGLLLVCFAVQASVEELIFRGWLLSAITRKLNLLFAVLLSSALFTFMHFTPNQPWLVTMNLALFAVFACCWVVASNSVWGAMGWHAGWNWMLATGFEVPVTGVDADVPALVVALAPLGTRTLTGGAQGPEGSLACSIFFACGIAFFVRPISLRRNAPSPSTEW